MVPMIRQTIVSLVFQVCLALVAAPMLPAWLEPVHASSGPSLDHLNGLKDVIETPEGPLPVWYIYASPSAAGYRPLEAAGEGIACVDDVARALMVYLEHYELTGDTTSLAHARDAVTFLAYMRQDDGTYANFVHRHGNRNLTGITSRPGINWWMARAMWGLAKARTVFASVDPEYARWIDELLRPSLELLAKEVEAAARGGVTRPATVGGGNDVSAIFLLAVSLLHSTEARPAQPGPDLERIATALALGLRDAQAGDPATPPYRAVLPNPGAPAVWTGWGSHGMEALALAGLVFDRPEWISWAAEIAHALGTYLVSGPGSLAALGPAPIRFPQIAYDQSPLVRGLEWLYRATAEPLYADLAVLAGSWLLGNNPAREPMHHLPSGRTYDGIDGDTWGSLGRINYSSGAESTVEGLSILLALERIDRAADPSRLVRSAALTLRQGAGPVVVEAESHARPAYGVVEIRRQDHLEGSRPGGGAFVILHDGSEITLPLPSTELSAGRYRLDLVHGGARAGTATLYVLSGEEVLATVTVGRDRRGDQLRTTHAAQLSISDSPASLRIYVEGGPLVLDAVTLHPTVIWRQLEGPEGRIIAFRNVTDRVQLFSLPQDGIEEPAGVHVRLYDQRGIAVPPGDDLPSTLAVPPYGFGIAAFP